MKSICVFLKEKKVYLKSQNSLLDLCNFIQFTVISDN